MNTIIYILSNPIKSRWNKNEQDKNISYNILLCLSFLMSLIIVDFTMQMQVLIFVPSLSNLQNQMKIIKNKPKLMVHIIENYCVKKTCTRLRIDFRQFELCMWLQGIIIGSVWWKCWIPSRCMEVSVEIPNC